MSTLRRSISNREGCSEAIGQSTVFCLPELLFDKNLAQYASAAGIDARRVINEILTGVHIERVREDFRRGARAGVNGTPTFFINGARYDGEVEADRLIAMLVNSD